MARLRGRRRTGRGDRPDPWAGAGFGALGDGNTLMLPAVVHGGHLIEVGRNVKILPGAFLSVIEREGDRSFGARLSIGDGCRFGRELIIACFGSVEIASDVLAADRVFIGDTYHDYRDPAKPIRDQPLSEPRPVRIGAGSFLGINSCVLPGVTVGDRAYVGAGAVVTADVPALSVVAGNPARVVRRFDAASNAWVESRPGARSPVRYGSP